MEPKKKKMKTEDNELKEMIYTMQDIFFNKLKNIEEKIDKINSKYLSLEKKIENIFQNVQVTPPVNISHSTDDYPNGSWLGDPNNPDFRVKCPITTKDLDCVNNSCTSAEKMSLTLLDYLFSREIQACSNLSGTGKHRKKQLDPNLIHGIKCHVTYMFGIGESDWNRIKLNIDSKCRTAFRRKSKGMPLDIRGVNTRCLYKLKRKDESSQECVMSEVLQYSSSENEIIEGLESKSGEESSLHDLLPVEVQTLNLEHDSSLKETTTLHDVHPVKIQTIEPTTFSISSKSEIIQTEHGKIQVIHATKEQFELFKQNHNIQVLSQPILTT